ncbi:hypothetical protein MPL3356_60464 [Mesorhizobium plurifarium]|uniref:Uncharacterized protein n=1 Tax=Mesorhizobium plurifarium TaxID=69974 RepID=A0A090E9M0_MESPL|nr:hypothetical protein MPL3356_60464 [Mesorhizobium plurifarium]
MQLVKPAYLITKTDEWRTMDIPAEVWIAGAYGGIIVLAAVGRYLTKPKEATRDPVIAGIALGFGDERFLALLTRCAVALEALADRRTEELTEMHQQLIERLDRAEQHNRRVQTRRR